MPHDQSWLSILLGSTYETLEHAAHALSWPVNDEGKAWLLGGHITIQHVLGAAFVFLILAWLAIGSYVHNPEVAIVPQDRLTVRTFVEVLVGAIYKMMSDMMGKEEARFFLPLIGTCAFFILISNALGLVPGFLPPTNNLNTTFAFAIVIFLSTHVFGVKKNGIAYFKHFLGPPLPFAWPIRVVFASLMLILETISHLARPLTLAIRLMANMVADHMVLSIFLGFPALLVFLGVPLPVYMLGFMVVVVQTLVFCLLSTVYISMAIAHEEH